MTQHGIEPAPAAAGRIRQSRPQRSRPVTLFAQPAPRSASTPGAPLPARGEFIIRGAARAHHGPRRSPTLRAVTCTSVTAVSSRSRSGSRRRQRR